MIWGMAWQGFKEHPVLGWGQENFNLVFNKYYNPEMYAQEQWFDRTHNIIFDWLIDGGILGLAAYLSIFAAALWVIWKKSDGLGVTEKSIFTGLLGAYFFQNLFVFDNLTSYFLFFTVLGYLYFKTNPAKTGEKDPKEVTGKIFSESLQNITPVVVGIALILALYFFNYQPMTACSDLIQALSDQSANGGIAANFQYFKDSLALNTFGRSETREQLVQTAIQVASSASVSADIKNQFLQFAAAEMDQQIKENPDDARYYYFTGTFYDQLKLYPQGLTYLKKAHELSPGKQTITFEMISSYIGQNDIADALTYAKQAFDSAPEFQDARIIYAAVAIYNKDDALADQLLAGGTDPAVAYDSRVLEAYFAVGNYKKVVDLLNEELSHSPNNLQLELTLAAAYQAAGQNSSAVKELQAIETANPNYKDQIDSYIKDVQSGQKIY